MRSPKKGIAVQQSQKFDTFGGIIDTYKQTSYETGPETPQSLVSPIGIQAGLGGRTPHRPPKLFLGRRLFAPSTAYPIPAPIFPAAATPLAAWFSSAPAACGFPDLARAAFCDSVRPEHAPRDGWEDG